MPRYQHPHNQTPPAPPDVCELAVFPVAVVPYALGALESRVYKYIWSDEGYLRGVQLIRSMQMSLLCGGMKELTDGQDRLYRLLDTALTGRVYSVESTEPLVITPAITVVPEPLDPPAGIVAYLDELPGIINPGWFGIGGQKTTLADVVNALRIGNDAAGESFASQLGTILGATGDTAQIGELVVQAFTGSVEAVEEGGIFVLLAAGIVGTIAGMGGLSVNLTTLINQMSRVINTLDGGGFGPPADSILEALRGNTPATETRNVIDSIVAALALITTDDPAVLAKLEEIRLLLS